MYYKGSYLSKRSEEITVHIVTRGERSSVVAIGAEDSPIQWTGNPVEIESCVNDTFDVLLRQQATIRLQAREFVPDFFCRSCMEAVVNIYKGDRCVFAGFIEPQTYSQSYNELYDELELSCIDVLSALQYSKYADIGTAGISYSETRMSAGEVTFKDLISGTLLKMCSGLDIVGGEAARVFHDMSKAIAPGTDVKATIFDDLSISELLFLGKEEDNVWDCGHVLEEILKYLNLHIVQDGLSFRIFSWETIKGGGQIEWHPVFAGEPVIIQPDVVDVSIANIADTDTSISVGQVFNQLLLTCNTESVEDLIESPLDDDALVSPYSNRQLYMTEYSSDGNGTRAHDAFWKMTHGEHTDYDAGTITDWYLQVKTHPSWIFPEKGTGQDLVEKYCKDNANQQTFPNLFYPSACAGIFSLGKVVEKTDHSDNSPVSKVDMDNFLVVSVNGNGKDGDAASPTEGDLLASTPRAVYTGGTSGAVYSPVDPDATNYIVISGKITMNPVMKFSGNYPTLSTQDSWPPFSVIIVPSRDNEDGRFYTQRYYKAATPFDDCVTDLATSRGLVPFTGTGEELYEFKYSAVGDNTDKISKVAVLACMLVIGDKCVVETGSDGQISDFEWRPFKTRQQCATDDEYYAQCFTIGFNPKIGDKLIGTQFDLQNNIDYRTGIDAEGIAIPIKASDRLGGAVKFMILGPVNTMWGDITRRHKTWFRREKYGNNQVPLLAHTSNILLQDLEIKIYSDNGLINNLEESDLVYMSDTDEEYVNKKDDLSFSVTSALTLSECRELGIPDAVKLSTPKNAATGLGLLSIFDRNKMQQVKPEINYLDSYYTEYHRPRVMMDIRLEDTGEVDLFTHLNHPAMEGKEFFVQSIGRDLTEGTVSLSLKEIEND